MITFNTDNDLQITVRKEDIEAVTSQNGSNTVTVRQNSNQGTTYPTYSVSDQEHNRVVKQLNDTKNDLSQQVERLTSAIRDLHFLLRQRLH